MKAPSAMKRAAPGAGAAPAVSSSAMVGSRVANLVMGMAVSERQTLQQAPPIPKDVHPTFSATPVDHPLDSPEGAWGLA